MLYLQLSGWTAADAFLLGLFMIGAYLSYAYLTALLVDIEPLRRSEKICFRIQNLKMIYLILCLGFFNRAQLARVDAINDGLSLILETYLMSLAKPWKTIASNIDKNLLKRRKASTNKFLSRADFELDDPLRGY